MKPVFDTVYLDFFRTGLLKLQKESAWSGDFWALFSALEQFRRDLNTQSSAVGMLHLALAYLDGLECFKRRAFYMINPADFSFELAAFEPEQDRDAIEAAVRREIKAGRFAWALRQSGPVFISQTGGEAPLHGVFHSLSVASRTLGIFYGELNREHAPRHEVTFSLLTIVLGICSDALGGIRTATELQGKILAANRDLQQTLHDNQILARFVSENPAPVLRVAGSGQVLFSNAAGLPLLEQMRCRVGDFIGTPWLQHLEQALHNGARVEFECVCGADTFNFVVVGVPEAGYANFYGKNITLRKRVEAEREALIRELQEALNNVRTLSGLLPICAWCKKVRDDQGYWKQIESYVETHSEATFSHGVCPDCLKRFTEGGPIGPSGAPPA